MCLSVCSLWLLRYRLVVFFPPLPKVGCPKFLGIQNPWGKVMKRSGLLFEFLLIKDVKTPHKKKIVFFLLIPPYLVGFFRYWCLSLLLTVFFPHTSQSPMSKLFRFLESLEKSYGKKRSQIWKLLLIKGVKLLWHKSFLQISLSRNVRQSVRLFVRLSVCSLLRYRLNVFLPPLPKVGCPIFLKIRNHLGKVMERSCLRFEHFCLKVV